MVEKKKTRKTASVSLHRKLYEKIETLAMEENRTISNMLAQLVGEGLKYRDERSSTKSKKELV